MDIDKTLLSVPSFNGYKLSPNPPSRSVCPFAAMYVNQTETNILFPAVGGGFFVIDEAFNLIYCKSVCDIVS